MSNSRYLSSSDFLIQLKTTHFTNKLIIQRFSALTHPTGLFARITNNKGVIGNILCNYRPAPMNA